MASGCNRGNCKGGKRGKKEATVRESKKERMDEKQVNVTGGEEWKQVK